MTWILIVLGAALAALGFLAGRITAPEAPEAREEQSEEDRLIAEREKQWDALMSYTGRPRLDDR